MIIIGEIKELWQIMYLYIYSSLTRLCFLYRCSSYHRHTVYTFHVPISTLQHLQSPTTSKKKGGRGKKLKNKLRELLTPNKNNNNTTTENSKDNNNNITNPNSPPSTSDWQEILKQKNKEELYNVLETLYQLCFKATFVDQQALQIER